MCAAYHVFGPIFPFFGLRQSDAYIDGSYSAGLYGYESYVDKVETNVRGLGKKVILGAQCKIQFSFLAFLGFFGWNFSTFGAISPSKCNISTKLVFQSIYMIIWDIFGYLNLEWIPFFDGNTSISVFLPVTMVLRCGRRKQFFDSTAQWMLYIGNWGYWSVPYRYRWEVWGVVWRVRVVQPLLGEHYAIQMEGRQK